MGVWKAETVRRRFMERVEYEPNTGCWLWSGARCEHGYGMIRAGRVMRAHRLSFEWERGLIPPGHVVMHRCDTPACVNPDHLRLGTQIDNIADRHTKGRSARTMGRSGEKNSCARLTETDVRAIKTRLANRERVGLIAQSYSVHSSTISQIKAGKNWSQIDAV